MPPFLYRCPNTGLDVQGFTAEEVAVGDGDETFEALTCTACSRVHLVNPKTGRVLSVEEE